MKTTAKIITIGNSKGMRLPKQAPEESGLAEVVKMVSSHNKLVIRSPARHTASHLESISG